MLEYSLEKKIMFSILYEYLCASLNINIVRVIEFSTGHFILFYLKKCYWISR